jgi:hypothetical protein
MSFPGLFSGLIEPTNTKVRAVIRIVFGLHQPRLTYRLGRARPSATDAQHYPPSEREMTHRSRRVAGNLRCETTGRACPNPDIAISWGW